MLDFGAIAYIRGAYEAWSPSRLRTCLFITLLLSLSFSIAEISYAAGEQQAQVIEKHSATSTVHCAPIIESDGQPRTITHNRLEILFQDAMHAGQLWLAALLALLAGFLTSLSPCVYPLIPITLGIMGARPYRSHWEGFFVSSTYVSGMVLLYCALGLLFASLGWLAGSILQSPLFTFAIAVLFVVMAFSMFGAFELVLPARIISRLVSFGGGGI